MVICDYFNIILADSDTCSLNVCCDWYSFLFLTRLFFFVFFLSIEHVVDFTCWSFTIIILMLRDLDHPPQIIGSYIVQSFIYSTFIILFPLQKQIAWPCACVCMCYLDGLLCVWTLSRRHIPSGLNPLHSYGWHANSQANCPLRKINLGNWLNSYRPVWKSLRDQRDVCLGGFAVVVRLVYPYIEKTVILVLTICFPSPNSYMFYYASRWY